MTNVHTRLLHANNVYYYIEIRSSITKTSNTEDQVYSKCTNGHEIVSVPKQSGGNPIKNNLFSTRLN